MDDNRKPTIAEPRGSFSLRRMTRKQASTIAVVVLLLVAAAIVFAVWG